MTRAYSRVTVLSEDRRVDVALPGGSAVSELMPQLLELCSPNTERTEPARWVLARVGGAEIAPDRTLTDAGVTDGDLLELQVRGTQNRPAYVEDVRDALEDAIDHAGLLWNPRATFRFALYTTAFALALLMLFGEVRVIGQPLPIVSAAGLAGVLVGAALWAAWRGERAAVRVLLAVACGWGALCGWLLAGLWAWPSLAGQAAGAVVATVVAAGSFVGTRLAAPHLAATGTVAIASSVVAAVTAFDVSSLQVTRAVAVICVLVIGALPRVALAAGGVANADYQVRNASVLGAAQLAKRIRLSAELLTGSVLGISAVAIWLVGALALSEQLSDRLLAAVVAVAVLLRSRVFSQVHHVVPLRVAGLVGLAVNGLHLYWDDLPARRPLLLLALVAVVLVALVLSSLALSDIVRARIKRTLNIVELAVVVLVLPVAATALGLFDAIGGMTR
ncbi:type VII secretion integral membrane protein EccD [Saccharopolyspora sp. WRP15-2]|uniref:Type VII secretion integral membrane protein EccD n=1 Tax=Saccharopolyspora oryzae TaxID=2997343 RepID=A0ABT4VAB4_9PSEU|nr:type VII secretion integral membrane protein EccD [Saccharopolyspora oryzae]MDA3630242.1 type VII secretion integral membrane protein EccD [Saccharopolyspora oryzae]